MKNIIYASFLAVTMVFTVVGCNNKKDSNGNVGAIATANGACPAGSFYSNGICYNGNGQQQNAGYYLSNGYYADNWSGYTSLNVTDPTVMKKLLKYGMAVCDLAGKSYGQANCDYWMGPGSRNDIVLQFPPNATDNALLTIIAQPKSCAYGSSCYAQLPSGSGLLGIALGYLTGVYLPDPNYYSAPVRDPLQIQMAVSPTNNNAGFVASGYGDAWSGLNQTVISIRVMNGTPSSTNLPYELLVGGQQAATGTMTRCQYPNCGL